MKVRVDSDINGITAKWLRSQSGLPQDKFWEAVGVAQPTGSQYESGVRPIPRPIKKLLFIKYEAGVSHDTGTLQGADELRELAAKR